MFFFGIFFLSIGPLQDPDLWTHLKAGELVATHGLMHTDIFAYTTKGREWFQNEWLFEYLFYELQQAFGIGFLSIITALLATLQVWILYKILKKIFSLSSILSLFICSFYFVSVFEFLYPRPQIFAMIFFLITIFLLFLFIFKNKNYLWIAIPITILWANIHGSVIFILLFFGGYTLLYTVNHFFLHIEGAGRKGKILGLYTAVLFLCSILPPIGIIQYRLLWFYVQNQEVIRYFIDEWAPLEKSTGQFLLFLSSTFLVLTYFFFVHIKQKKTKELLLCLPLFALILFGYQSVRNTYFGYAALVIMLGWAFSYGKTNMHTKLSKYILYTTLVVVFLLEIFLLIKKKQPDVLYYPTNAIRFIKTYHLKGNMFNDYSYGSYMIYYLYPQQKVFIDGRADLYACCEMKDYALFAANKNLSDEEYKKFLDIFWMKYKIDFVVLSVQKNLVMRKVARILDNDPSWSLVFWDDTSEIFMRKDGKNETLIKKYAITSATPYDQKIYKGQVENALNEYQHMIRIADSSQSRNAIGYIYLQKKNVQDASNEFEKAIQLDPSFESPYMNLGEIAAYNRDYTNAIALYQKAQELAPERRFIPMRISQLQALQQQQ